MTEPLHNGRALVGCAVGGVDDRLSHNLLGDWADELLWDGHVAVASLRETFGQNSQLVFLVMMNFGHDSGREIFQGNHQKRTCNMSAPAAFCLADHLPEGCLLKNQDPATPMREWAPTQLMLDCGICVTDSNQLPILCPVTLPYGAPAPKDPLYINGVAFVLGLVPFTPSDQEILAAWYKHQGHQGKSQFKLDDKLWSPTVRYEADGGFVTVTFGGFDRIFRGSKKAARQMFLCGDNGDGQVALFRLVHFMDDINGERGHFKRDSAGVFVPSTKKDWWIGFVKETDDTDTDDAPIFQGPAHLLTNLAASVPFDHDEEARAIAKWFPTAIGCVFPPANQTSSAKPNSPPAPQFAASLPPVSPIPKPPASAYASPGAVNTVIPRKKPKEPKPAEPKTFLASGGENLVIDASQGLNLDLFQVFDQLRNLQQVAKQLQSQNTTLGAQVAKLQTQNAALTNQVLNLNKRKPDSDPNPNPKKKPQVAPQVAYPANMSELAKAFMAQFDEKKLRESHDDENDEHLPQDPCVQDL